MRFRTHFPLLVLAGLLLVPVAEHAQAAEKRGSGKSKRKVEVAAEQVEFFQAIDEGQIKVKFIPKSEKEANVLIENKTAKPLSVRMPNAFAGVPVLAQAGFGGQGGRGGIGAGGGARGGGGGIGGQGGGQTQGMGGGFGGGGGGGLGGGGGGGFFNVRPEQVAKLEVACVCLEHGKENPRAKIPYEIRPIGEFTENESVHELLKIFANSNISQKVAQAAAWHLANGMSWEELSQEKFDHLARPDEAIFSRDELLAAMELVQAAKEQVEANRSSQGSSTGSKNAVTKL